jgi:predicted dehydrogenase
MERRINWGMIGCGDVTEKKSAPSFNKIDHSSLVALTSRSKEKAVSYAERHGIPRVYDTVEELLADPGINALYIATPPSSHAEYAIKSLQSGKPVYVEKPMATTFEECVRMNEVSEQTGIPLFVAYYRRSMEYFLKVLNLLEGNAIGKPYFCQSRLLQSPRKEDLNSNDLPWRVIPEISGGGYFHDMGCHEIDLMCFLFGEVEKISGMSANFGKLYDPEDTVLATIKFENGVLYHGAWCFTAPESSVCDEIEIIGDSGTLRFSCFAFTPIEVNNSHGKSEYEIQAPEHVQLPMIRTVVGELLGKGRCPSNAKTAARVNWIMERILGRL